MDSNDNIFLETGGFTQIPKDEHNGNFTDRETVLNTESSKNPDPPIRRNARKSNLTILTNAQKSSTSQMVMNLWTVIHPQSNFKKIWDLIMILLLVYTAIIMPYRIAFIDGVMFDGWWWLDNMLNVLFFIDFTVNCFLAYFDEYDNLIFAHSKIFLHYLRGWMVIDLIGCLPFDLIVEGASKNSKSYNSLLRLFRLPRLYRLLKISKIFKMLQEYKNSQMLMKIQEFFSIKQSVTRLIGVFFKVLICVHIFACIWVFVAKFEGLTPETWIFKHGYLDTNQYIISLYWCFVTFSTVGYGDITPGTPIEIFLAIFWMLFGICFYSFIIGSLASILSSLETKETVLLNKLAAIDEFSKETNLSKDLRIKVRTYVKSMAEFEGFKWSDKKDIYFQLPKTLRYEISLAMHSASANFLNFFKYRSSNFVSSVIPFLSHVIVLKDNFVYKKGEYADEIFFLLRGKVEILDEADCELVTLISLLPGGCFGDIEVVKQKNRMHFVKCLAKCSLLVMNCELLEFIQQRFNRVWHDLVIQACENDKIFELVKKYSKEIRKVETPKVKSLKEMNEYFQTKIAAEMTEESNWNLGSEIMTQDDVAANNLEACSKCVNKIKESIEKIDDHLNEVFKLIKKKLSVKKTQSLVEIRESESMLDDD